MSFVISHDHPLLGRETYTAHYQTLFSVKLFSVNHCMWSIGVTIQNSRKQMLSNKINGVWFDFFLFFRFTGQVLVLVQFVLDLLMNCSLLETLPNLKSEVYSPRIITAKNTRGRKRMKKQTQPLKYRSMTAKCFYS